MKILVELTIEEKPLEEFDPELPPIIPEKVVSNIEDIIYDRNRTDYYQRWILLKARLVQGEDKNE